MEITDDRSMNVGGDAKNAAFIGGDNNKVEINYFQGSPKSSKRLLPPLLPYLVNRGRQISEIKAALDQSQSAPRPRLFILHGDDEQSHDMLLKRIETRVLPGHFRRLVADTGITRYDVPWPEDLNDVSQLHVELTKYLIDTVQDPELPACWNSIDEINQRFKQSPGPVMLTTCVLDVVWREYGAKCIEAFLEFWNRWPSLGQNQQLLVFLTVKYVIGQTTRPSLWSRWLKRGTHKSVAAEDVANALELLSKREWKQLLVCLLPKLDGIDRNEVENWAKSGEVKKHGAMSEQLIEHIGEIFREYFGRNNSGQIPMERIAEKLKLILKNDAIFEG